jgi:hypothetical protein
MPISSDRSWVSGARQRRKEPGATETSELIGPHGGELGQRRRPDGSQQWVNRGTSGAPAEVEIVSGAFQDIVRRRE